MRVWRCNLFVYLLAQEQLTIINRKFLPLVAEMSGNFCNFASRKVSGKTLLQNVLLNERRNLRLPEGMAVVAWFWRCYLLWLLT